MKGFTAIEILIVIAIAIIIAGISLSSFSALNKSQALGTETDTILSMIERARSRSISSENSSEYGVRFATSSAALFSGKNYSASSSNNEVENLNSRTNISSINLTGGASAFYFKKITGKPSATGTIVVSLIGEIGTSSSKTITIYSTGLSDVR